jgi:hypothetical protein
MVFIGGNMKYTIETADNGWIVSWWDDEGEEPFEHHVVFAIPEEVDESKEDPQSLIDLLYFVKENICGQYSSKHKRTNIRVTMEKNEDGNV